MNVREKLPTEELMMTNGILHLFCLPIVRIVE